MNENYYGVMFDEWCKAYDPLNLELSYILNLIGENRVKILYVGSGTGRLAIPLSENGHKVYALEVDKRLQDTHREKISKNSNMELILADFEEHVDLPDVDVVLFSWSLICMGNKKKALEKAKSSLIKSDIKKAIFIEPWDTSDYADIVLPFMPSSTERIDCQKSYIEPISTTFEGWSFYDYGIHQIPYVFNDLNCAFEVFRFALTEWHGIELERDYEKNLKLVLQKYKKNGKYYIFESPKFMWVEI